MDIVSLTTHVCRTDQQTRTIHVIYATQPSPNMNGRIMKVQNCCFILKKIDKKVYKFKIEFLSSINMPTDVHK